MVGPRQELRAYAKLCLQKKSESFLDDKFMIGPPPFTNEDLQKPRLRQCTYTPDTIAFESWLGGGVDGDVWKVWFENEGPFALKVFWKQEPPEDFRQYYALQRECQNAAVLQMMQASVESAPVLVFDGPVGLEEARHNFYSFSDENAVRKDDISETELSEDYRYISSIPRMTKCYGWLKISGNLISSRQIEKDKDYVSLVYELIEDGENVPSAVEMVDDFLWHAGFTYTLRPLAKNWKRSILVDHSDIVHFDGFGWSDKRFEKRKASDILQDKGNFC